MTLEKLNGVKPETPISKRKPFKHKEKGQFPSELVCDLCGSVDIAEHREGFTCRDCGVVLNIQKLEHYLPYNDELIQHSVLGTTQIGTNRERFAHKKSVELLRLNKRQSIKDNETTYYNKASFEISRIFSALDLPMSLKPKVIKSLKKVREQLKPGTKYRSMDKLVPVTIYFVLKKGNISVDQAELLEVSDISKKDFNKFKLPMTKYMLGYNTRDKMAYVSRRISGLVAHFGLEEKFYSKSMDLLRNLWDIIHNTSDDVMASLSCSIVAVLYYQKDIKVSHICKYFGTSPGNIQNRVKDKIVKTDKNFTLVKCSEVLKQSLIEMKLIASDETKIVEVEVSPAVIEEVAPELEISEIELTEIPISEKIKLYRSDRIQGTVIFSIIEEEKKRRKFKGIHSTDIVPAKYIDFQSTVSWHGLGPPGPPEGFG